MLRISERDQWVIFEENRAAVVAALRRGECEAILPAARTFLDDFTGFLHRHEILEQFGDFPDHRARGRIPAFFFCVTLLHLPLFRLHRLADIEGVLFRSPFILRLLGFNARQIAEGFYATTGPRPFTAEALGDFFADVAPETLREQQLVLLGHLHQQFPEVFRHGVYAMDCMTVSAPPASSCASSRFSSVPPRCPSSGAMPRKWAREPATSRWDAPWWRGPALS